MKHTFVCVGFPKCATTTVDAILRGHPDLALPCYKETIFFGEYKKYITGGGLEWYEKRYYGRDAAKYKNKILGEINPVNIGNGNVERNILDAFGEDTKIIYFLRNPVDAVFSFISHLEVNGDAYAAAEKNMWREGFFDSYVEEYLYSKARDCGERNRFYLYLYGRYIATALKYVPRQNIHIMLFEDFVLDAESEVKKLLAFIGARTDVALDYKKKENIGKRIPRNVRVIKKASCLFSFWANVWVMQAGYLGERMERMLDDWYWSLSDWASVRTDKDLSMSASTRKKLADFYRQDVVLLDRVLGTNYQQRWKI